MGFYASCHENVYFAIGHSTFGHKPLGITQWTKKHTTIICNIINVNISSMCIYYILNPAIRNFKKIIKKKSYYIESYTVYNMQQFFILCYVLY